MLTLQSKTPMEQAKPAQALREAVVHTACVRCSISERISQGVLDEMDRIPAAIPELLGKNT